MSLPTRVPVIARFLPSLTDLAFLMPLIFVFGRLQGARTLLGDGDTGWHIRTGEWILAHGQVPQSDIFSFSRPGAPWFAWEWLWDVLFALLHRRWGMAAVVVASLAVICATTAVLFRLIRRKCGNGLVAIAVTLLATGGCAIHWLARPHLFTILFLAITLHITDRAAEGRTRLLGWLVPLTLLWTNLHGGFFVIFLVLGCYLASNALNGLIDADPDRRRQFFGALKPWAYTFAACFAVTFINPYGWQLHRHVIEYLNDPYQFKNIAEFQSIDFHSPAALYFETLIALAVAAAIFDARNRRFADMFLVAGWLHLALIAQRNLPLFAIASAPMIGRLAMAAVNARGDVASWIGQAGNWFHQASGSFEETDRIGRVHLAAAVPLVLIGALLILTPSLPGVRDSKLTSTYNPEFYPEKALATLRTAASQNIFSDDEWGDYLIYQLYPGKKVFIDGRSDFYGAGFGGEYLSLINVQSGWQKVLDRYSIDTVVLAPRFSLTQALKISREWRVVSDDGVAVVFRRNAPAPVSLVSSHERKIRDQAIAKPTTVIARSPKQTT